MNKQNPTIAIIGATGATGKYVLEGALERGFKVRVLARNPDKLKSVTGDVEIVEGSVDDREAIKNLLKGAEVVLSTLGTSKKPNYIVEKGVRTILNAIQSSNAKTRFVHMSAVGLGDSKKSCKKSFIWSFIVAVTFPLIGRELFADMERAEHLIIDAKEVDSIIMRAAILNDKPARGYKVHQAEESVGKMFISRRDIASFMLDAVGDTAHDGKAISLFSA